MGVLQLSFKELNWDPASPINMTLADLQCGEEAVLERLDLPDDIAQRLMELGFLPGSRVVAARCAPGGDPRVYRIDGSEIALRVETAACLRIQSQLE